MRLLSFTHALFSLLLMLSLGGCGLSSRAESTPEPSPTPHGTESRLQPLASPSTSRREDSETAGPANPALSPGPTASLEAPARLTDSDSKQLLTEFTRAQSQELQALKHRQTLEFKELKAAQKARQTDWDRLERDARHKFFAEHPKGPDRRAYIGDFRNREQIFYQVLADERTQRQREQDARVAALQEEQALKLKEFKETLEHHERPSTSLWPAN